MASHSGSSASRTPAAQYQLNARRKAGNQPDYVLESLGGGRREENRTRSSGESQEELTKVQHTMIAKVNVDQLV
jgi:hypothetical protein